MEDIPSPSSGAENPGTMGFVHYYLSTAYQLLYGAVKQESTAVKQESTAVKQESAAVKQESTAVKQESVAVKQESAAVPPEECTNQQPQARKAIMIGCCGVEFFQLLCPCSLSWTIVRVGVVSLDRTVAGD